MKKFKKNILMFVAGLITRLDYTKRRSILVDRLLKKAEKT
jgi:hypothetical protein